MKKADLQLANISCPHIKGVHKFVKRTLNLYIPDYPHRSLNMGYLFGITNGTYAAFKLSDIIPAELK